MGLDQVNYQAQQFVVLYEEQLAERQARLNSSQAKKRIH